MASQKDYRRRRPPPARSFGVPQYGQRTLRVNRADKAAVLRVPMPSKFGAFGLRVQVFPMNIFMLHTRQLTRDAVISQNNPVMRKRASGRNSEYFGMLPSSCSRMATGIPRTDTTRKKRDNM